jgi:hypothetical protein
LVDFLPQPLWPFRAQEGLLLGDNFIKLVALLVVAAFVNEAFGLIKGFFVFTTKPGPVACLPSTHRVLELSFDTKRRPHEGQG